MMTSSVPQRIQARLRTGATTAAIAAAEGLNPILVDIVVDDLRRRGELLPAESLCASGLGACGTEEVTEDVLIHCAGCPLMPLRRRSA